MRITRRAAAYGLAAAFLFCCGAAARAQGVMDQVPSDALAVLKINRLEQTNQKVGKWTTALGIAQLHPDAADPLGAMQNKLNIKEGLDRGGDAAIVLLDPAKAKGNAAANAEGDDAEGGSEEEAVLILVPVTNYKAFVGQLPNANAAGAITSFKPEDGDKDAYAANWGKYAAISPSKAVVQNKPQGSLKSTGLAARELKDKDIVLYANMPAIKAKALPQLQKMRQQVKQQMAQGLGAGEAGVETARPNAAGRPATPRTGARQQQRNAPGTTGDRRSQRPQQDDSQEDSANQAADKDRGLPVLFQQQPAGGTRQRQRPAAPPARQAQPADQDADNSSADNQASDDDAATAAQNRNRRGGARQRGAGAGAGAGGADPAMAQAMSAMVDQYFAMAERFLNDAQAATIGVSLNDSGLNSTALAEFTPNSYLGNIARDLKNTDQGLLTGLPDRKYFAFGGINMSPKAMNQIVTDVVAPMFQNLSGLQGQGQGQNKGNTQELTNAIRQIVDNSKTVSIGYTVPTGALGADSIIQAVTVTTGNAKAIHEAERKLLANMGSMFQGMPGAGAAGAPKMSFEVNDGAKTVGGVKLDQYKFNLEMDGENDPRAAQAQQMMAMVYGPNGMSGAMGAVNDNTFLVVQGGTDKLIADAVASAKGGQDALSKSQQVQAVRSQLPKQRVGEWYVALDNIIRSGVQYAQGFGLPVKMQLPNNLPPIGGAVASEGTAVRVDGHIPTTLLQNVMSAGMQAYMQMQGGGAGNPDGL